MNGPAIDAPARCTTASTPSRRSAARLLGAPEPIGADRVAANQANHGVTSGCQKCLKSGADQARRAAHRDPQRAVSFSPPTFVGSEVAPDLTGPIGEHLPHPSARDSAVDRIGDPAPSAGLLAKRVCVAPPDQRSKNRGRQHVYETAALHIRGGVVAGAPLQAGRQGEHRLAVTKRVRLFRCPDRLPGRHQSAQSTGAAMPPEHIVDGMVEDRCVLVSHRFLLSRRRILLLAALRPQVRAPLLRFG